MCTGGLNGMWAWDGARSLWQTVPYREAVRAASVKVNAETQNMLARRATGAVIREQRGPTTSPL